MELQPKVAGRRLHISRKGLGTGIVRVDEEPNDVGRGDELMQQLQPLWSDFYTQAGSAGDIAARPVKACHQAELHRIEAGGEHNGNCRRRCPCGQHRNAICCDRVDLTADQLGRQRWQTIVLTLRPPILDCDVLSFNVAGVFQALAECARSNRVPIGRCAIEKSDHRHRLLRSRGQRQRDSRAAEQRYELATLHSISSSASPANGSGTVSPRALATLRLMTRVYLSARWIGKSPGFAPLRMRST